MTTVEATVTPGITENRMSLKSLGKEIAQALQQAGRQLIQQACQVMQARKMEEEKGMGLRDKRRSLGLRLAPADLEGGLGLSARGGFPIIHYWAG
jgi:hypothetical protein